MPDSMAPYGIVLASALAYWLLFQFIYEKKYRSAPLLAALLSFCLAGFGSWLLASVGNVLFLGLAGIDNMNPWGSWWTLGIGNLIIAADEEVIKFLLVLFLARTSGKFSNPPLALVFAAAAALGFATMENLSYAQKAGNAGIALRAITAMPVHLGTAAIWSLALAKGRFLSKGAYWRVSTPYLLLAVVLHALYNQGCYVLAVRWPDLAIVFAIVFGLVLLGITYLCLIRLLAMHQLRRQRALRECCPKCGKEPETHHSHCTHCGAPLGIGFGLVIRPTTPRTCQNSASKTPPE